MLVEFLEQVQLAHIKAKQGRYNTSIEDDGFTQSGSEGRDCHECTVSVTPLFYCAICRIVRNFPVKILQ